MRPLFESKWSIVEEWSSDVQEVSFQFPVAVILAFLHDTVDKGKAFSAVKVYLAAISAFHVGFDGKPVWQHPLVCRFMRRGRHNLQVYKPLAASWDLPTALDAISTPPFEPLEQLDLKMVALQTVLLLSLGSAKGMSEIHTLSVHKTCTRFSLGNNLTLPFCLKCYGHVPQITSCLSIPRHSPQLLCLVRTLHIYIDTTKSCRKSLRVCAILPTAVSLSILFLSVGNNSF